MSILDAVQLDVTPNADAVRAYLVAQDRKSFADHADFFAEDVHFNGLILNAHGADAIASAMDAFLPAIRLLEVDAATRVETGAVDRYLVLYRFALHGQEEPLALCDHITVRDGRITRVDNIFDARRVSMPS